MNEAETRAELIDPALREAGWGVVADSRVRRETICPGRIEGAGRRGKPEIAEAGGKDQSQIDAALQAAPGIVADLLG